MRIYLGYSYLRIVLIVAFGLCLLTGFGSSQTVAAKTVPFKELGGDQCFMFSQLLTYQQQGDHYIEKPLELVIDNEADYQKLFDPKIMRQSCAKTDLAGVITKVDFSSQTVLGLWNSGSCSASGFTRNVEKDDVNKAVIYSVSVIERPIACSGPGLESLNLIAIPRIPDGYRVVFNNTRE